MDVREILENPQSVSKDQFLQDYWRHHTNRPQGEQGDTFSLEMYRLHEQANNIVYWKGMLKDITGDLQLPHHFSGKHFVRPYGEPFSSVVEAYSRHVVGESCCNDKVLRMKHQHGKIWIESGDIDFLFLSDDSYLAHKGGTCSHYHNTDAYNNPRIFIGAGLHRIIAYGLLCKEQGRHIPIDLYCCQYA